MSPTISYSQGAQLRRDAVPMLQGKYFTLIGRPTLYFRVVREYKAAGFIPSVYGVTLDGARQTFARLADVVIHGSAA